MAVRQGVWIVKELLMLGYLAALVVLGFELAIKSMRFMSQAMQLSQFYLYLSTPVGSLLFLIRELILIRRTYVKDFGGRSGDPA
jgi:TRAP-type C4-dicarboxylate transport system permease small subunit